jgi:hypothetical protein
MKAKRQIESSLNSVTMLDGTGGHVTRVRVMVPVVLFDLFYKLLALVVGFA